jgi:hypothetical protein
MNKSYDQQLTELQTKAKIVSEEYASLVKRAREKEAEGEAIKQEYIKLKKLKLEEKKTEIIGSAEVHQSGDEILKDEIAKLKQQLAAALAGQGT